MLLLKPSFLCPFFAFAAVGIGFASAGRILEGECVEDREVEDWVGDADGFGKGWAVDSVQDVLDLPYAGSGEGVTDKILFSDKHYVHKYTLPPASECMIVGAKLKIVTLGQNELDLGIFGVYSSEVDLDGEDIGELTDGQETVKTGFFSFRIDNYVREDEFELDSDAIAALQDGCAFVEVDVGPGTLKWAIDYSKLTMSLKCPCGRNGVTTDDPHFKTWSGEWYDYMGECDMHYIHAPNFTPTMALDIDIRTKIRYDYSYIESAVAKIGDETFEVTSFGGYFLNGVANADLPATLSGFPIVHSQPSEKIHLFEIHVTAEEKIVFKTFKDWVSVKIEHGAAKRFHGSSGMLGEYETGRMLGRDGNTVLKDPVDIANEWQVRKDEPLLFMSRSGPQHPQVCRLPDAAMKNARRRLGEGSISLEAAQVACAGWSVETRDACVHDVMAMGDLDLALAGAF
jgi:hypothetical protein